MLDIAGERLREGRLLTTPPGYEERLLSGVANGALRSAQACARFLPSAATSVDIMFGVDSDGRVREAVPAQVGELSGCIAGQFASVSLAGVKLPITTRAKLRLVFAPASADGGAMPR
jgi:hypothetical protein